MTECIRDSIFDCVNEIENILERYRGISTTSSLCHFKPVGDILCQSSKCATERSTSLLNLGATLQSQNGNFERISVFGQLIASLEKMRLLRKRHQTAGLQNTATVQKLSIVTF
jgi:hypothetical protein